MEQTQPEHHDPEIAAAIEDAAAFIGRHQSLVGSLAGIRGMKIIVGDGFATSMKDGTVTVDPSFFIEHGYRPEWCMYGTLHELTSHLHEMITEPELHHEKSEFYTDSPSNHIFMNILDDVAGNRKQHAMLPSMAVVADEVYKEKLFAQPDMTELPKHLQLIYEIIRTAMIVDDQTVVSDDVADALSELRNVGPEKRDAIDYVTNPRNNATSRYRTALQVILPVYEKFLQEDIQEHEQNMDSGGDQGSGPSGDGEQGDSRPDGREGDSGGDQGSASENPFEEEYNEYWDNHPEPMSHEDMEEIAEEINSGAESSDDDDTSENDGGAESDDGSAESAQGAGQPQSTPDALAKRAIEAFAGASYDRIQDYRSQLETYWPQVEDMKLFYEQLIARRLATRNVLQSNQSEGILVDPALLPQAYISAISGNEPPAVMMDYTERLRQTVELGGFDFYIASDASGSMMRDGKSKLSAICNMIIAEGLDVAQQSVVEAERASQQRIGLDIRTEISTFGSSSLVAKELSPVLEEADRLKIYDQVQTDQGGTGDYLALERIDALIDAEPEPAIPRQKLILVISDGQSGDAVKCKAAITRLRDKGVMVMAVSIGSRDAERLYAPHAKYIADATELPEVATSVLQEYLEDRFA